MSDEEWLEAYQRLEDSLEEHKKKISKKQNELDMYKYVHFRDQYSRDKVLEKLTEEVNRLIAKDKLNSIRLSSNTRVEIMRDGDGFILYEVEGADDAETD